MAVTLNGAGVFDSSLCRGWMASSCVNGSTVFYIICCSLTFCFVMIYLVCCSVETSVLLITASNIMYCISQSQYKLSNLYKLQEYPTSNYTKLYILLMFYKTVAFVHYRTQYFVLLLNACTQLQTLQNSSKRLDWKLQHVASWTWTY